MSYNYESELVDQYSKIEKSNKELDGFGAQLAHEYYYNNGRVDIVKTNTRSELIAIEAKLTKWRVALNQAYRNTSFAHYSYVLLPKKTANHAMKREAQFKSRGVGILTIDDGKIKILLRTDKKKPLQPWLTKKAFEFIKLKNQKNVKIKDCSSRDMQRA